MILLILAPLFRAMAMSAPSKPELSLKENLDKLKRLTSHATGQDMVEKAKTMPMIELKAKKIDFGTHKGLTFEEAAAQPGYAEWVASHVNPEKSNPTMQMFVEFLNRRTKTLVQQMEAAAGYGGTKEDTQMKTGNTKKRGGLDELFEEKVEKGDFEHWTVTMEEPSKEMIQLQEETSELKMRMGQMEIILMQIAEKLNLG